MNIAGGPGSAEEGFYLTFFYLILSYFLTQ